MPKPRKPAAIGVLKKEIRKRQKKMRSVMRKANARQRKQLKLGIKRLDTAFAAISTLFDDTACLAFDDSKSCVFAEE